MYIAFHTYKGQKMRKYLELPDYREKCSFFDQRQAPKMCVIFGLFSSGNTF